MAIIAAVLAALFMGPVMLHAAESAGLAGLIAEAAANNPELLSMRERVRAAEAGARASGNLEDPTLKMEMMDLSSRHAASFGPGNAMETRYMLSQAIPFPGKLSLEEKMASKEAAATRGDLASKTLDIAAFVKEAYFDYAFLDASQRINNEVRELLAEMARIAESRYSTGLAPQQDVIRVHIEESMLTGEGLSIAAGMEAASARLKYILGRQQDSVLDITPELPVTRVEFSTSGLIEKAVVNNPAIRSMADSVGAAEAASELSRKAYYPDLMAGAGPVQRDGKFDTYDVMLQINIPIWFGKTSNRSEEASAAAAAMRSRLMAEQNIRALEVKQAAIDVETADRMLSLYSTGILPQALIGFESALKNYQSGKIDFLTLIETERTLKTARLDYIRTLLDYRKKVAALERAVGEDF
ncbi:MAG: TolC family protein [Deltaproteobacteria bacterium]|nr:TolC family protein [Deltaproteobacteria bacterium]